jgi:hypothetical protein
MVSDATTRWPTRAPDRNAHEVPQIRGLTERTSSRIRYFEMKDERVSVALPVSEAPLVNEAAKACILRLRGGAQRSGRAGTPRPPRFARAARPVDGTIASAMVAAIWQPPRRNES